MFTNPLFMAWHISVFRAWVRQAEALGFLPNSPNHSLKGRENNVVYLDDFGAFKGRKKP
jgi:hypothetical protein